ncbi:hypothetical protein AMTRI_Chr04g247170 [Amborella trichopoda]
MCTLVRDALHISSMTSRTPADPVGALELSLLLQIVLGLWELASISFKGAGTNSLWMKVLFSQSNYPFLMPPNSFLICSSELMDSSIPMFLVALLL